MRTFPHVPIFQKAYKSYRINFFEKVKCTKFPVRCMTLENTGCTVKKTLRL